MKTKIKEKQIIPKIFSVLIISIIFVLVSLQAGLILYKTVKSSSSIVNMVKESRMLEGVKENNIAEAVDALRASVSVTPSISISDRDGPRCQVPASIRPAEVSLSNYLTNKGINSSFSERQKIAEVHGIVPYTGTQKENGLLLRMLIAEDSCSLSAI